MKKKKLQMNKLFSDKRFVIAVSLIVSFISWLVISIDQNPIREATISNVAIKVDIESTVARDLGLDIVNENYPTMATVIVEGPNYIVSSLKNTDLTVAADMSEVTDKGTFDIPIKAERLESNSGYRFVSISPSSIRLTFDYIDTREYAVTVKADGISAVNGLIVDNPSVSSLGDANLAIKGSKTDLDLIDSVVAFVKETEVLEATNTYDADILLYDEQGNMLDTAKYTMSAQKVKVTVPISKKKNLPVKPTFSNEPYANLGNSLVSSLSVDSVEVIGAPAIIDTLEYAELAKIDFKDISTNKRSFDVSFSLPDGVRVLENVKTVNVKFSLSGYITRNFTVKNSNIILKNIEPGLTADVSGDLKNVVMCGSSSAIKNISRDDLFVEIDLKGKSPGEYNLVARVKCKKNLALWQVGTQTITVKIK